MPTIQLIKIPPPNNGKVEENCNTTLQTELHILKQAFGIMKNNLNHKFKTKYRNRQKKKKKQEEIKWELTELRKEIEEKIEYILCCSTYKILDNTY